MGTHTFALLELSETTYNEISKNLHDAGYDHAFMEDGVIDMHGIGIRKLKQKDIQKNTDEKESEG